MRGDCHFFESFNLKAKAGVSFNLTSDTLKLGIVDNTITPTVGLADPRWGNGGSNDFSAHQVPTATAYTGPITLSSVTFTRTAGVSTLSFSAVTVAQDAGGFTNGYWGIIYDDTTSGKYAIGYVDLGAVVSITGGVLTFTWNASGFGTNTAT